MKNYILFLIALTLFTSCDQAEIDTNAKAITYKEIVSDPNYSWFASFYDNYLPYDSLSKQITENFKKDEDSFLIFASLACDCGENKEFPKYLKVLREAGILNTTIYNIADADYSHPYQDKITLTKLPSFYKLSGGEIVYSIVDSLSNFKDIFDATAAITDSSAVIEQAILDALKK